MSDILDRVTRADAATVWTPADFLDLAGRDGVDKTLQRLTAAGHLRRVKRGLYDRPRVNALTGRPGAPDPRAIVDALVRRDGLRVLVDGITAAHDLGLTTAVPSRIVVLTDARLRPIRLGNQEITFRQVAPSRLYWANRPAMRVVQALHWLRDVLGSPGDRTPQRLRVLLLDPAHGPAIRRDLRDGFSKLPIWMQRFVRPLLDEVDNIAGVRA